MCEQLIERRHGQIQKDAPWQALCAATGKSADDVSTYLRALLEPIASHDTDYYNEDAQLGGAINDAVTMAGRVASWPKVLQALTKELNIDLPRLLTASVVKLQPKVANPVAVGAIALLSTHITELGLDNAAIGPTGLTMLATAIHRGAAPLRTLRLTGNVLCGVDKQGTGIYTADGLSKLCDAISSEHCRLEALDMRGNCIFAVGAALLGGALATNRTLTTLDLSDNNLHINGAASIGDALRVNRTLRELDLGENQVRRDAPPLPAPPPLPPPRRRPRLRRFSLAARPPVLPLSIPRPLCRPPTRSRRRVLGRSPSRSRVITPCARSSSRAISC